MAIGEDLLVTVLISFSLYGYTFQQNCHNMVNHVLDNEQVRSAEPCRTRIPGSSALHDHKNLMRVASDDIIGLKK